MKWRDEGFTRVLFALVFGVCISAVEVHAQSAELDLADPRIGPPDNPANINSSAPNISANGRAVAFFCYASNVVPNDTNGATDVFVVDRLTLTAQRVSVSSSGVQANGGSLNPKLSGTGRFVVFQSMATNLVSGDTNAQPDILLHDRATGSTSRINLTIQGFQANGASADPAISRDGYHVVYASAATNLINLDLNAASDIFVHDLESNTTTCASVNLIGLTGNDYSQDPAISANGRFIAFESLASDLVLGDINASWDIFVRDTALGITERVSVSNEGIQGNGFSVDPSISGDGRYVSFMSAANNLVPGDTNGVWDCFVYDRLLLSITRVNNGNGSVQGNGSSSACELSDDGRFAIFRSFSSNLVSGDTNNKADVFVRDLVANTVARVSLNDAGQQSNDHSYEASVSQHGVEQVFLSQATNLDPGATSPLVFRVFTRGMPARNPADVNDDGIVDGRDIASYATLKLRHPTTLPELDRLDIDGNGMVDARDTFALTQSLLETQHP